MSAKPTSEAEARASESVVRLRARLDVAVTDLKRILDDIEATAARIADAKGASGEHGG